MEHELSTDFTLYALDEAGAARARDYMSGSMGYGNTNMAAIIANNGRMLRTLDSPLFDYPSVNLGAHTSLHGDEEPCVAHDIVRVVGHGLPVIEHELAHRVLEAARGSKGYDRLAGFLDGARGRLLWYVFV